MGRRKWIKPGVANEFPVLRIMHPEQQFIGTVAERLLVAQRHDKTEPDANVAGGACNCLGVVQQPVHADRRIDMHHGSDAGLREASEGESRIQIRIDGRLNIERRTPQFKVLITRAEADVMKSASVIMRINKCRHRQQSLSAASGSNAAYAVSFRFDDGIQLRSIPARS